MNHNELMYDATPEGVPFIPRGAQVVAGYVDGLYQSYPDIIRDFPQARHVSIGIFLGHLADFTDVEPGNPIKTPALVRADFEFRKAHGVWRPGYYADATRMANTVLPGLSGIPASEYRLWLADWDGDPNTLLPFDAGKQYTSGAHYDISVIDPTRMFPAPPPHKRGGLPKPKPIHPKVLGSTVASGLATAIIGTLHAAGAIHLTPAEYSAIAAFCAAVGGWTTPSPKGK